MLPQMLLEGLQRLCQRLDVTLFMLLLASLQVLLMHYTEQTDISIGIPVANRRHSEVEGLIGFFVNTLVMRTSLAGNPTFEEFLARVREVCLSAYVHQDVPFEKVVEALECIRVQPWALETSVFGTKLHVMVMDEAEGKHLVQSSLDEKGIAVHSIQRIVPSLEDVFLYLLERDTTQAAAS